MAGQMSLPQAREAARVPAKISVSALPRAPSCRPPDCAPDSRSPDPRHQELASRVLEAHVPGRSVCPSRLASFAERRSGRRPESRGAP